MENLTFHYPSWLILFCVLLGVAFALGLYFRDKTYRDQPQRWRWIMGGLRFFSVTLLSLLLLAPLIKSLELDTQRPIVVLAQDASQSITAEMNADQAREYRQNLRDLGRELARDYELKTYSFGDAIREELDTAFEDKVTNISEMLTTVYDLYSNQNLGAVILATDGVYNKGSNPLYTNTRLSVPVFTVALGDTTPKRDLLIKRVLHNRIAYLGDRFSIQVDISAQNCGSAAANLLVEKVRPGGQNERLESRRLNIDNDDFFQTEEILIDADASGVQRYRLRLTTVDNEASTANNSKDIFIDVLDARQKILILANSPHPDLTALRQSITSNKNYEVTVNYIDKRQVQPSEFDLVILHQLPSRNANLSGVLNTLVQQNIPHWFILGKQTDLITFNESQPLVDVQGDQRNTNDVQARVNSSFNAFILDDPLKNMAPNFPPLLAPFGEYNADPEAAVMLYQRIGSVETQFPLLLLGEEKETKIGVLCAEGLWKWRLFNFLQNEDHQVFNALVGKVVQYLSVKEDKRKFRVNLSKNIYDENEGIFFDAELYNDNYELVNGPDVSLVITNSEGKEFNYTFNKTDKAYALDVGPLPVGNYSYDAMAMLDGERLTNSGQFSVQPIQLEMYETTADHRMLRLLSDKYGGALFGPNELEGLLAQIRQRDTVKPVIYETTRTRSVLNLKWLFFVLIGVLSLEWFLRRYLGGY